MTAHDRDRDTVLDCIDEWAKRVHQYRRLKALGLNVEEPRSYRADPRFRMALQRLTAARSANDPMAGGKITRRFGTIVGRY